MSTEINSVGGSDFGVLGEFQLDLHRRGLVLVTAENRDTGAADSNGGGKSTLLSSLCWGLFEKTPNGLKADEVIRRGQSTAMVDVAVTRDGEPFIVRRIRKKGKRVAVLLDGVTGGVALDDPDAVNRWVEEATGLDFESFRSTVLYAPGGRFFGDPAATDSERKALLHRVLNTGPLEATAKAARNRATALRDKAVDARARAAAASAEASRAGAEATNAAAKHAAHAEEQGNRARALRERAAEAEAEAKTVRAKADKIEAEVAAARKATEAADAAVATAREESHRTRSAYAALESETAAAARLLQEAARAWLRVEDGKCPECGADATALGEHRALEQEKQTATVAAIKARHPSVRAAMEKGLADLKAAEAKAKAALAVEREASSRLGSVGKGAAATAETLTASAAELRAEADEVLATASPWAEVEATARAAQEAHEARSARAAALAAAASTEAGYCEFWARGFGQEGLPALMLDESLPEMEERGNEYLRVLADGDIILRTASTSKTKAGAMRERMAVTWEIEGVEEATPSTGQERKLKLATGLALMDIACSRSGNRPDLLMLDEALDGLDAEGRSRVVRLLKDLRARRGTILVVTHEPSMADAFEREIVVVKEGGVARIEER